MAEAAAEPAAHTAEVSVHGTARLGVAVVVHVQGRATKQWQQLQELMGASGLWNKVMLAVTAARTTCEAVGWHRAVGKKKGGAVLPACCF